MNYTNSHYHRASTVEHYDCLRAISPSVLLHVCDEIIASTDQATQGPGNILEQGAGNGRVLIPLMRRIQEQGKQHKITAIDESAIMLNDLEQKAGGLEVEVDQVKVHDIQRELPFTAQSFDTIYTFAVYHILSNPLQAAEYAFRVLRPEGAFIYIKEINQVFHGTEGKLDGQDSTDLAGMPLIPEIKEFFIEYHRLREAYGVPYEKKQVEYSDASRLFRHLQEKGMEEKVLTGAEFTWEKPHTFRHMLDAFLQRHVTTFGSEISDETRTKIYTNLLSWTQMKKISLDEVHPVSSRLELHAFSRVQNEKDTVHSTTQNPIEE